MCALWVLFHTTLANVERPFAVDALSSIAAWVNDFFGCEECAGHFIRYYEDHGGRDVQAGMTAVNQMLASAPEAPFGGVKRSGHGRELGPFGLHEFMNLKSVYRR